MPLCEECHERAHAFPREYREEFAWRFSVLDEIRKRKALAKVDVDAWLAFLRGQGPNPNDEVAEVGARGL
jgi:hypothetical protein